MKKEEIKELINRRRLQVLIHSCIYYRFDESLISDETWSKWAKELYDLQNKYPEIAKECILAKEYKDFDYSTGMNLPISDLSVIAKAEQLIEYNRKYNK